MAQCKYCGRSGLFLSVGTLGMCKSCEPVVAQCVLQSIRVIQESAEIVTKSKNLDTRISRCGVIVQHAEALSEYERKGITTSEPPPSAIIARYEEEPRAIAESALQQELAAVEAGLSHETSAKVKVGKLAKLHARVRQYRTQLQGTQLTLLERSIADRIHQAQLNGFLDSAHKAEFSGNRKKAIQHYFDALYFLKHDEIDDELQSGAINTIEAKLRDLGATPGVG